MASSQPVAHVEGFRTTEMTRDAAQAAWVPSAEQAQPTIALLALLASFLLPAFALCAQVRAHQSDLPSIKRPVTVEDGIEMMRMADPNYFDDDDSTGRIAIFSHDGKRFVIVVRNGDIQHNTNQFAVLLFQSADALLSPKPEVLVKMSSSSNRDAIRDVRWLADDHTLVFLGENPGEVSQVYSFDVSSHRLKKLTNHLSAITKYDITSDGSQLAYIARPLVEAEVCARSAKRVGIVVTGQALDDLMKDPCGPPSESVPLGQLFLQSNAELPVRLVASSVIRDDGPISLAPDGSHLLVGESVQDYPAIWSSYRDGLVRRSFAIKRRKGNVSNLDLKRYLLVDARNGTAAPLLDTPSLWLSPVTWAPDGKRVYLERAFLPLDIADVKELEARERTSYSVEVEVPSRQYRRVDRASLPPRIQSVPLSVSIVEDVNTPPKIYVVDRMQKRKALLLDLNPQFANIDLGHVDVIQWRDTYGQEWRGGLYLPLGYLRGRRYPLVIQTHGFFPASFSIDGMFDWSSAFAARPLAAAGFVVLQAADWSSNTAEEGPRLMAEYESAIDYLDAQGMIDRNRVGITGFSRTLYDVGYTLTHSTYHFAAADLADGIDAGYFQFLAQDEGSSDSALLNAGEPVGEGLQNWFKKSPTFNLDRVHTPVRLLAFGASGGLLENWEWFSMLTRLDKPIEYVLLPDAQHEVTKPWERRVAQLGLVDWFRYWLKDEQDSDPSKAAQYARWNELRRLQEQDRTNVRATSTNQE